jgi:GNAT superfamily N-acetyltransferase
MAAEIREATSADLDAVVKLGLAEAEVDLLRWQWQRPDCDRGWVAVDRDKVVGHGVLDGTQAATVWSAEPDVRKALLARVMACAHERGLAQISVVTSPSDEALPGLLALNGFALDREILRMWCTLDPPLEQPTWPTGLTVRTYSPADDTRVHALLDHTYASWDPNYVARTHDSWLAAMTGHAEFDAGLWFLVERDGTLVACALHWKESNERGWVKDIVVEQSERGNGLGTALLQQAFCAYAERGVKQVGLKVDSTNPTSARGLYERLGFVTDQRIGVWVKRL